MSKRYKTREEVNAAIDRYIARAIKAEANRDACVFESTEYWKYHDIAMYWHDKAESLMAK